jgi:hypothetical protein
MTTPDAPAADPAIGKAMGAHRGPFRQAPDGEDPGAALSSGGAREPAFDWTKGSSTHYLGKDGQVHPLPPGCGWFRCIESRRQRRKRVGAQRAQTPSPYAPVAPVAPVLVQPQSPHDPRPGRAAPVTLRPVTPTQPPSSHVPGRSALDGDGPTAA